MKKNDDMQFLIQKIDRENATKEAIKKHRKKVEKLLPFPCSDGKTVFYCTNLERGNKAVKNYESKLKLYK